MRMRVDRRGESLVAILEGEAVLIRTVQDALDALADAHHLHGCDKLLIPGALLDESFFDLRSGFAGEVLQKFVNYGMRVAITGDFGVYTSKALQDFIRESNKGGRILFVPTQEAALDLLHA